MSGYEWRMFLRMGDCDVAFGHNNFLRGQEEFEGVPSRTRIRSLENDAFRVSFSCFMLSIGHTIPTVCRVVCGSVLESSVGHPEGDSRITIFQNEFEDVKKEHDGELTKLREELKGSPQS